MNNGVQCRHGSDPLLLWLWHRPAVAVQILPLARELQCHRFSPQKHIKKGKKNWNCTFFSTMSIPSELNTAQMYSTVESWSTWKYKVLFVLITNSKAPCVWADVCKFCQAIKRYWYSWVLHWIGKMNKVVVKIYDTWKLVIDGNNLYGKMIIYI